MPLLPSALPLRGEARRYVTNDFLNLIALLIRDWLQQGNIEVPAPPCESQPQMYQACTCHLHEIVHKRQKCAHKIDTLSRKHPHKIVQLHWKMPHKIVQRGEIPWFYRMRWYHVSTKKNRCFSGREESPDVNSELFKEDDDEAMYKNSCRIWLCDWISVSLNEEW